MQRSGNKEIRTQIQPSKPKREITKITNSHNTQRYGQPSKQLFLKRWPLSNPDHTKNNNMNTLKVNVTETLTPKQATENHNKTTALELSVMNYWGA